MTISAAAGPMEAPSSSLAAHALAPAPQDGLVSTDTTTEDTSPSNAITHPQPARASARDSLLGGPLNNTNTSEAVSLSGAFVDTLCLWRHFTCLLCCDSYYVKGY